MKTKTNKTNVVVDNTKNNVTTKLLSNEKLGEQLFNNKTSFEDSVKMFCKYYKTKQNIDDINFIKLRTKIYLRIAEKRSLLTNKVVEETVCVLEQ